MRVERHYGTDAPAATQECNDTDPNIEAAPVAVADIVADGIPEASRVRVFKIKLNDKPKSSLQTHFPERKL
jgi:hypothetical protein